MGSWWQLRIFHVSTRFRYVLYIYIDVKWCLWMYIAYLGLCVALVALEFFEFFKEQYFQCMNIFSVFCNQKLLDSHWLFRPILRLEGSKRRQYCQLQFVLSTVRISQKNLVVIWKNLTISTFFYQIFQKQKLSKYSLNKTLFLLDCTVLPLFVLYTHTYIHLEHIYYHTDRY